MRIISGIYKGKKILYPKSPNTRPLRDLVKESIFNLIENSNKYNISFKKTKILDLFSGSGSFGLECISRGAKKVTFVENDLDALKVLRKNILALKSQNFCDIINKNCFDYLKFKNNFDSKIGLIFLDPPYKEKKLNYLIDKILELNLLDKDGILITHRHKKDNLLISDKLKIIDERFYGISKII